MVQDTSYAFEIVMLKEPPVPEWGCEDPLPTLPRLLDHKPDALYERIREHNEESCTISPA